MEVVLSQDAKKQLDRLSGPSRIKIEKKFQSLIENPTSGKKLVGDLAGIRSIRAWPYRILYEINFSQSRVEVHKIAHRQGVYK